MKNILLIGFFVLLFGCSTSDADKLALIEPVVQYNREDDQPIQYSVTIESGITFYRFEVDGRTEKLSQPFFDSLFKEGGWGRVRNFLFLKNLN